MPRLTTEHSSLSHTFRHTERAYQLLHSGHFIFHKNIILPEFREKSQMLFLSKKTLIIRRNKEFDPMCALDICDISTAAFVNTQPCMWIEPLKLKERTNIISRLVDVVRRLVCAYCTTKSIFCRITQFVLSTFCTAIASTSSTIEKPLLLVDSKLSGKKNNNFDYVIVYVFVVASVEK